MTSRYARHPLLLAIMYCILAAKADDEQFRAWITRSWRNVKEMRPEIIPNGVEFSTRRENDLCEKHINTSQCFEVQSEVQQSIVVHTGPSFGSVLYLDCEPQSSSGDEHIYHESLVHPGMVAHGSPGRVFIAGGGEGATAREVLRYSSVEALVMVDLDEGLVRISQEHLPYWDGVEKDPRFQLHIGDAIAWLRDHPDDKFDVIVLDLPDCTPRTAFLYRPEVFALLRSRLNPGGVVSSHAGGDVCTAGRWDCRYIPMLHRSWEQSFGAATVLMSPLPMWNILHGFMVAQLRGEPLHTLSATEVDRRLQATMGAARAQLQYYGGDMHRAMVHLEPVYERFIDRETQTMEVWGQGENSARRMTPLLECGCDNQRCLDEDGHRGAREYAGGGRGLTTAQDDDDQDEDEDNGEEEDEDVDGGDL